MRKRSSLCAVLSCKTIIQFAKTGSGQPQGKTLKQYCGSAAVAAKQFYERFISKLKPHQSVWLVPGLFGFNATGPNPTDSHLRKCWGTVMAEADEVLVEKMSAYWAWADADPRITGVIPWHW